VALAALLAAASSGAASDEGDRRHDEQHRFVAQPGCKFANGIKHVVHITFDNVHLHRDNPNVPSDLEQMPSLLNFLATNGTVGGNHHMPLISHTATDILTALSGLYGDRMGVPVSNSYRVFDAAGNVSASHPSFIYWTATDATDGKPVMLNEHGTTAPAPWVPFTRLGCDVGAFSVANMEFETLPGDAITVFGAGSPDAIAAASSPTRNADYLGIAIHCAKGSPLCANPAHGKPDALPDEPGGYVGFSALFGNKHVQPMISSTGPIKDLDGNVIGDTNNTPGFANGPGFPNFFNPLPTQALGYLATMLEAGVQVVYAYIADAHDNRHGSNPGTFGPGEAGYVAQLKEYDTAFKKFFDRLAQDGIDQTNTLFIVTADEGDHFVGGIPSPAGCDGVTVPCIYVDASNKRTVGELTAILDSLLLTQTGNKTPFLVHADDAPPIYISGNPSPTDVLTRTLARDIGTLTFTNPLFGKGGELDQLAPFMADRAEMKLLHMVTASPARTPSFTVFGDPDYFFQTTRGSLPLAPVDCSKTTLTDCVFQNPSFAWNHGDVQQEIVTNFLAIAGPGVRRTGIENTLFSDHTDIRPTMLALLGLSDDYVPDGRVLIEKFDNQAQRAVLQHERRTYTRLARAFKQINAPVGELGLKTLALATTAIKGDDAGYAGWLTFIDELTSARDALTAEIKAELNAAVFGGKGLDGDRAEQLLRRADLLLGHPVDLGDDHDDDGE
jgi:hypothetical protein